MNTGVISAKGRMYIRFLVLCPPALPCLLCEKEKRHDRQTRTY